MPKYAMQSLMTAAERALENAGNSSIEASLLAKDGRFGRGLSLSIPGREEAQKSILLASCAAGLYDPSDSAVGLEIRRALEDHDYKHESAWKVKRD